MLHQSANGKPETVGQREIVAAGQHRLIAAKQGIVIELVVVVVLLLLLHDLVDAAANAARQVVVAVVTPAAQPAAVHIVVPLVRREAGHHPHGERDEDVGQQQKEPNLHGQRIHKREEPRRRRRRNLVITRILFWLFVFFSYFEIPAPFLKTFTCKTYILNKTAKILS